MYKNVGLNFKLFQDIAVRMHLYLICHINYRQSMLTLMRSFRVMRSMAITKPLNGNNFSYYQILGVAANASPQEIRKAYTQLVEIYHPSSSGKGDSNKFQKINEAYVILSNESSKRAYDLVRDQSKGKTFIQAPFEKPKVEKSQYANELEQKNEENRKAHNIDQFGRYRGGLPRPKAGLARGTAMGTPGQYQDKLDDEMDADADYQYVDTEKAQSFKDFHQDERDFRTIKWTWIKAEVDYQYFKPFKTLRYHSKSIKLLLVVFLILPFYSQILRQWRNRAQQQKIRAKNKLNTLEEYSSKTFKL